MKRSRTPLTSICLALLVAGCGSDNNGGTAQGGSGGSSSSDSSASSGSSSSGGSSSSNGSSSKGGSSSKDGSSATSSGGSSKTPSGGSSSSNGGSVGGGKAGNGGGNATTGTGGSNKGGGAGGSAGKAGGTVATGGASGGAVTSAGGGKAGDSGAGGTSGSGGATTEPTPVESLVVTSANGAYWKPADLAEGSGTASVTVNENAAQTWDGFGGAFNEMGWSYLTTDAMKDEAIKLLFGKDGCNFAWGRIPIGASDYAVKRYTLNENAGDNSMSKFSIEHDKDPKIGLIPYIKAAQKVKEDIRFWASPWTPPTWMKTTPCNPNTGRPSNSMFDGCVMKGDDTTLKAFALYLVKWIQAYEELGIKIQTVAPQNEPNYEQNYPSCHWNTADYPKFIGSYLGPALESAGLTTKVMNGTLSNATGGDADIGSAVLRDATAKKYLNSIGVQWGMAEAGRVSTLKGLAGGIPIWISETQCGGNMNTTSPAPNDFSYAQNTWGQITSAIKAGITAYNAWNMVLDKVGMGNDDSRNWPQNALLVADGGKIIQTPAYFVYRHFSQFVQVGAKVLGTSGGEAVAFKNPDESYVVVMFNNGSANAKYTVSVAGKSLQFSMPSKGWATLRYSK